MLSRVQILRAKSLCVGDGSSCGCVALCLGCPEEAVVAFERSEVVHVEDKDGLEGAAFEGGAAKRGDDKAL